MSVTTKWALAAWSAVALATLAAPGMAKKAAPKRVTASYSRVERSLAGIRLGTRATTLLKLFPHPQVEMGSGSGATTDSSNPFGGSSEFGGATSGMPPMPGMPTPGGPPSPFPTSSGMALPMPGGNPFGPTAGGATATDQNGAPTDAGPAVTYVYKNFRKIQNVDVMVQLDEDSRVIQIIATSPKSVPSIITARGLSFGATYDSVVARYGWPESHVQSGNFLQLNYQESAHVAFQLLDGKVRRIVVAEVN
ncbi:MAG TPA: hypothetical protein VGM37_16365 [Armatimonadota bacterium]